MGSQNTVGHHSGYVWYWSYQVKQSKEGGRGDNEPEPLVPGQKGGSMNVTARKGLVEQGVSPAGPACHSAWIFLKSLKGSYCRLRVDSMEGECLPRS